MRSSRWWDLPAVLLLLAAILTAAGRLVATEWVDHLTIVQTLVILGMILGLTLGRSTFPPWVVILLGLLYGLFLVPWQLGLTIGRLSTDALWSDRLVVLANRLLQALSDFAQQEPVRDPVLFLSAMALLAWGLSVHAGYVLTRRASPWCIILPSGLATVLIHTSDLYRPRGAWYLAAYLLFSLLLVARVTFLRWHRDWIQDDARVPPLIGLDLSYTMVAAVVLIILLAWAVPAMADILPAAKRVWDRATSPVEERIDELFASLRRRGRPLGGASYYGAAFSLGQGRRLSDALMLSVQVPSEPTHLRYYWRARVYDQYADGQWSTEALTKTRSVRPNTLALDLPEVAGRRSLTFTFTSPRPVMTLYAAQQPREVSRRVEVVLAENPDGTVDVASLQARPPLGAGESYAARSSVADVTVTQLRDAGTDYPRWILDRYLEVPDTVTPRMRELAERIAQGQETPYDVAAAVTQHLRDSIRYSDTITETPPSNQEPLDWFLFDSRVGFCNWYASSEVILLRSLGIPARLAVGFAEGELQPGTNTHLVYERNAHAWPEVYFPDFGWIEFEPTVSEAPIYRPSGEGLGGGDDLRVPMEGDDEDLWRERLNELRERNMLDGGEAAGSASRSLWARVRPLLLPVLMLIGIGLMILGWRARRRHDVPPLPILLETGVYRVGWEPPVVLRRWAERARLSPVERAYSEVDRALRRLGAAPAPADTPAERAAALVALLPPASESTHLLLAEYQAATYSGHRYNAYLAQEAARSIRDLSWRAVLLRLLPWE